jgi:hypothetical protein
MKNKLKSISALVVLLLSVATVQGDVIFVESFTQSGTDAPIQNHGWHAHYSANATSVEETTVDFYVGPIISKSVGAVTGTGFYIHQVEAFAGEPSLHWTAKESSFGEIEDITNITFWLYNQSSGANLKVALRVENDWFVSQDVFNATGTWAQQSLAVQTAAWNTLSFTAGTLLSEGGAISLPTLGTVTAVGIFDASGISGYNGRTRIDEYTVEAIPEPATLGMLAISAVCLMVLRRCR